MSTELQRSKYKNCSSIACKGFSEIQGSVLTSLEVLDTELNHLWETQQFGCYPQRGTPRCFHRFLAGLITLRILLAKQTLAEPSHREEKQTHPVEQVLEEVEQVCGVGLSPDCCSCRQ